MATISYYGKTNTTIWARALKKGATVFAFFLALSSCKTPFPRAVESSVFRIWNELEYPHQKMVNGHVSRSLEDLLTHSEISMLDNWRKSAPFIENFRQSECIGCSNKTANLKPVYRFEQGEFIHFGIKNELGTENLVFTKRGRFVFRFYTFQGQSKEEMTHTLKNNKHIDYVAEGLYPTAIDQKTVYLEYIEIERNAVATDQWYPPMFPLKINYKIDLAEKIPVLRFKIDGGLFSYQRTDDQGEFQIINFVEPLMYANAVGINEPMSYSSFTDAFYANATFFLLHLEEDAQVSIHIETKTDGKDFKFSVLQNEAFYTMEEYLRKESPLLDQYVHSLEKGKYLIRVLHQDSNYAEKPLYTVYIDKTNEG